MKSFIKIIEAPGYYQTSKVYRDLFDKVNNYAEKENLLIKNFSIIKELCTGKTTYAQVIFEEQVSLVDKDGVKFNHIWSDNDEYTSTDGVYLDEFETEGYQKMETIKELEEERKNLIDKLHNIEKFIKENTNRDERGIFPKDTGKLLVNELNLIIARANTINDYLGLIDRQLELLYLKEKISK